jgi:uncharacterized protein
MKATLARALPSWALLALLWTPACGKEKPPPKYVHSEDGYLMVLREGDDAFAQLTQFAVDERLQGATFTGFGFGHATFGYFDATKQDFDRREFRDVELASLTGSIAWKDGVPALHVHAVATDRTFAAHGGHLLALQVGHGSLELQIESRRTPLLRQRDEALGADVLVLPHNDAPR